MAPRYRTPSFRDWTAVVLHRPHADRDAVTRQMQRLGIEVTCAWPALSAAHRDANVVVFDGDMGHEEQFPWGPGVQPMPMIALIGTEAPGRVEWAIGRGAGAHLNKPIGSSGVFGALVIAQRSFETRREDLARIAALENRLARRPQVAQAIIHLMHVHGCDADEAYRRLRELAMAGRLTVEDAADQFNDHIATSGDTDDDRREA